MQRVMVGIGSRVLSNNYLSYPNQGCQRVRIQTKNPNLGKFWRALDWKMFIYFVAIWNTYFMEIWDIL
jgi:hypothetical protein